MQYTLADLAHDCHTTTGVVSQRLGVASTTPITYLILIGHVDILAPLYRQVVIPQTVAAALLHRSTPAVVRAWIAALPSWCAIRQAHASPDTALMHLGTGERDALVLAQELGADACLIEDLDGRAEAIQRGMVVMGTLGILERAAVRGLIDLPTAITHLQTTTFQVSAEMSAAVLARDAARKASL